MYVRTYVPSEFVRTEWYVFAYFFQMFSSSFSVDIDNMSVGKNDVVEKSNEKMKNRVKMVSRRNRVVKEGSEKMNKLNEMGRKAMMW